MEFENSEVSRYLEEQKKELYVQDVLELDVLQKDDVIILDNGQKVKINEKQPFNYKETDYKLMGNDVSNNHKVYFSSREVMQLVRNDILIAEIPPELVYERREEQLAFKGNDKYISIHETDEGYDYTVYDMNLREIDGGVYDDPEISIRHALGEILEDFTIKKEDLKEIEFEDFECRTDEVIKSSIVEDFKKKTKSMFNEIQGLSVGDIECTATAYIMAKKDEYDLDIHIKDVVIVGSRCRGLEQEDSDIDIVVELDTEEREDMIFNVLHEDGMMIAGMVLDINPITEQKSGTLEEYLLKAEKYLSEKAEQKEEILDLFRKEEKATTNKEIAVLKKEMER